MMGPCTQICRKAGHRKETEAQTQGHARPKLPVMFSVVPCQNKACPPTSPRGYGLSALV